MACLTDRLNGVEVVDSWVQTNLIHDGDAGILALLLQRFHTIAHIAGRNNILLVADRALDDVGVECVGNERYDDVDLGYCGVERGGIGDVEGDRVGIGDALSELFGGLERSASLTRERSISV